MTNIVVRQGPAAAADIVITAPGAVLAAGVGTYTLTGSDAALTKGSSVNHYSLIADAGSYTLSGTAAGLIEAHRLVAGAGSYALTGTAASLTHKWVETAASGSYSLSGSTAALIEARRIVAGAGSFALSGSTAGVLHRWVVVPTVGGFTLNGTDAALTKQTAGAFSLAADPGTYSLTGSDATLTYAPTVAAPIQITTDGGGSGFSLSFSRSKQWAKARKDREELRRALAALIDPVAEITDLPVSAPPDAIAATLENVADELVVLHPTLPPDLSAEVRELQATIAAMIRAEAISRAALEQAIATAEAVQAAIDEEEAIIMLLAA